LTETGVGDSALTSIFIFDGPNLHGPPSVQISAAEALVSLAELQLSNSLSKPTKSARPPRRDPASELTHKEPSVSVPGEASTRNNVVAQRSIVKRDSVGSLVGKKKTALQNLTRQSTAKMASILFDTDDDDGAPCRFEHDTEESYQSAKESFRKGF
jgi:hypothetical protein